MYLLPTQSYDEINLIMKIKFNNNVGNISGNKKLKWLIKFL